MLDVRRGKLIVDRVMYVFTGNESQYVSVGQNQIAVKIGNNTKSGRAVCSDFANVETANNLQYIYITTSMTTDELKDYMANHTVQCVYLIATPIEVDVDPEAIKTLDGINNVWTDTGEITVTYKVDPNSEPTLTLASPLRANLGSLRPIVPEAEEIIAESEDPENGANLTTESEAQNGET